MSLALLSITSIIFFYSIFFLRKKFIFGFKESFAIGLFAYIYLPLFLYYFLKNYLINEFSLFSGYDHHTIVKLHYLTLTMLVSFSLGYLLLNRKFYVFKLNQNYSNLSIIIATTIFSIFVFIYQVPGIQLIVAMSILTFLLIYRSNYSNLKKIIFILLIMILFQYLSSHFYNSRRDLVKIFLLSFFFISLIIEKKKIIYILFLIFVVSTIYFAILTTFLRSPQLFDSNVYDVITIDIKSFISNYDFMPAFDNMMYILSNDNLEAANSLFKIFFSWIPRDIWPSKPVDTHTLVVSYRKNPFVGGTAQSVNLLGEVYWNFKWISVIFIFFFIGMLSKNFDLIKKEELTDLQIIFLSSLSYLIFVMWRGSITTTIIIYLINIFALIGLLMFLKLILKKI